MGEFHRLVADCGGSHRAGAAVRHRLPAAVERGFRCRGACRRMPAPVCPRNWSWRRSSASARCSSGVRSAASARPSRRPPPIATSTWTSASASMSSAWNPDGTATVRYRGAQWTVVPAPGTTPRHRRAPGGRGGRQPAGRRQDLIPKQQAQRGSIFMEFTVPLVLLVIAVIVISQSDQVRAAAERLGARAPGQVPQHADAWPELPRPLHRQGRLQAQPEGNPARRAEPDLHHARQHPAAGRRHPLLPGDRPDARELRLVELHRGHHATGADVAAQRDRQARARQDLRGARHHQRAGGGRPRRGGARTGA